MSSLDFANDLFSKYQQTAASFSALLHKESTTSPFSPSSVAPGVSTSCARSGYHLHASGGRGNKGLHSPPSLSSVCSFPSAFSSSWSSWSRSGLNRSRGSAQPAEALTGGAYSASGTGPLSLSLRGCASEQPPDRPRLCSLADRPPETACRRQSSAEQQQQSSEETQRIYPWMRCSGEEEGERAKEIISKASQVSLREAGIF